MTRKLKRLLLYMRLTYGLNWPPKKGSRTYEARVIRGTYVRAGQAVGLSTTQLAKGVGRSPETVRQWTRYVSVHPGQRTQAAIVAVTLGKLNPLKDYSTEALLVELLRREHV